MVGCYRDYLLSYQCSTTLSELLLTKCKCNIHMLPIEVYCLVLGFIYIYLLSKKLFYMLTITIMINLEVFRITLYFILTGITNLLTGVRDGRKRVTKTVY